MTSLIIILIAYVTSSMMLTLIGESKCVSLLTVDTRKGHTSVAQCYPSSGFAPRHTFSCLLVETLAVAVPYDQVDTDSALVNMFEQVGAMKCKYIVAVGALAGLTVSMFGSMFPMPRIVYAMAQDGLIFRYSVETCPVG